MYDKHITGFTTYKHELLRCLNKIDNVIPHIISLRCPIGPQGEVYKCWNDVGDSSKVIGKIGGKVENEVLLLRYLVGADPFEDPNCLNCFLLPVCGGGCPLSRIQKKYDGKEINYCPLIKDNLYDFLLAHINEKEKLKSKTL